MIERAETTHRSRRLSEGPGSEEVKGGEEGKKPIVC